MNTNLRKSGMKSNFKAYVSTIVLTTLLVCLSTLTLVPIVCILVLHLSLLPSLLFGIGASFLSGALTVISFYIYPAYRKDSLKRGVENDLPFTAGYMAILADAGVPPDRIFKVVSQSNMSPAVTNTARTIVRDIELFGEDVISALNTASKQTPSQRYRDFIEGIIASIHSGGNLAKYLRNRSRQYLSLKRIALQRFSDTLGILSEFYVTVMVAGTLIFVIMLAVMAMMGGMETGLLNPQLLLSLLTYLGLPIGSMIFLLIVDIVSPKR
jgi:flagellar protein FlaJ